MGNAGYIARIDSMAAEFEKGKTHYAKAWVDRLKRLLEDGRFAVLWGTGDWGMDCYNRFLRKANIPVSFFCDNDSNKWGKQIIDGTVCVSPEEIRGKTDCVVIIAVQGYETEISRQCQALGIPESGIWIAPLYAASWGANYIYSTDSILFQKMLTGAKQCLDFFGDDERSKALLLEILSWRLSGTKAPAIHDGRQYFIPELPIRADEAFVDAGAYNGDTLRDFADIARTVNSDARYYAFECGESNLSMLYQMMRSGQYRFPVEVFPVALWDHADVLYFSDCKASSAIDAKGTAEVRADTLDDCLRGKRVSWIKMDIEGAEPQALAGCSAIIREQKPRLTICVYHCAEHLYEIPRYIHALRSDYRMLLRHHSRCDCETVIYAY